jgi:hypothetical protein
MHSSFLSSRLPSFSNLGARFFTPLQNAVDSVLDCARRCPAISDSDWLFAGVHRALEPLASGRDFLQKISATASDPVERSTYFESLKSNRRLAHLTEVAGQVAAAMAEALPDALTKALPMLGEFEIFAGDGHWHEHAVHDKADAKGKKHATGHLFGLNLRTRALFHLTVADERARKKEHDMRGLKRQQVETLRQGTAKGRKVVWIWDRAGIDLRQWYEWKRGAGIYFISRAKENMNLEEGAADMNFDRSDPVNHGVLRDCLWAGSSTGVMMRWIRYVDSVTGEKYDFLTSITDEKIPPGAIAQLYRMRWDIEKVFDDVKNKQFEKKAWASSLTAKAAQAKMICLTHNLLRLFEGWLELEHDIKNEAELRRQKKRLEEIRTELAKRGESMPPLHLALQRITQVPVKFIRWLRYVVFRGGSQDEALASLRHCFATL